VTAHAKWFVLIAVVLAGLVAALSGCSDLGGPANSNGNVPGGSGENGIKLGTVTLTYDLESKSGTAEFVPNAQVSGEANIDTLTGIGFVWGKSTYDKRGVIPGLGIPGPAAVVSLAISNTSTYMILGPYLQFPTTLSGFRVDYPTAADAAPLELGDPDVEALIPAVPGVSWQRWVAENDGGVAVGAVTITDHAWASSYAGEVLNVLAPPPGDTRPDGFLTEYDSVAADKTYTVRFAELDAAAAVAKTWAPFYDEDGTAAAGPHGWVPPAGPTTGVPGLYAEPNATPPNPIACAIPMRFQQMPNGETPTRVIISATLYADALLDTRATFGGPKQARWDALKTSIGGFDPLADIITSVTRDSTGDILVGWLDASSGDAAFPPPPYMFQFSRLGSDLTMENSATIPIVAGLRTVPGPENIRGFAVNATRNRAYVAVDVAGPVPGGPFGGTVFSFDATTGAQADGGAGLNVAAAEGAGSFTSPSRIAGIACDDANGLLYVSYGDPVAPVARVVGYPLNATFCPTSPKTCASPGAGITLFTQADLPPPLLAGNLLQGGDLGVDGTGRVFVSSGINASPNGIVRLVRSGALLNYDTSYDIDSILTVPPVPGWPAAQGYDLFSVATNGAVTVYLSDANVPYYQVGYSPDLPGDSGPRNFTNTAGPPPGPPPATAPGFVHFSSTGVWDASTWLYIVNTDGSVGPLLGPGPLAGAPTSMFQAGAGPLATQKSVLIFDGGLAADAQMSFLNM
jgi:hypothetical protein